MVRDKDLPSSEDHIDLTDAFITPYPMSLTTCPTSMMGTDRF